MRYVAEMMNVTGSLNQGCVAAHPGPESWRCFMAEYTAPHVVTPIFALQSAYDAWCVHALTPHAWGSTKHALCARSAPCCCARSGCTGGTGRSTDRSRDNGRHKRATPVS